MDLIKINMNKDQPNLEITEKYLDQKQIVRKNHTQDLNLEW